MAERAEVVFVDGVRTPFGRAGEKGMYWNTRADDLVVKAIIGLLERNPSIPKDRYRRRRDRRDDADGRPGPHARPHGRAPRGPAQVGSRLRDRPHVRGRDDVRHDDRWRHRLRRVRHRHRGRRRAHGPPPHGFGADPNPRFFSEKLVSADALNMGNTAERIHDRFPHLTKERADRFALRSQQKAHAAYEAGKIQPDLDLGRDQERGRLGPRDRDEGLRPETTMEGLAALKTPFRPHGRVTAGNASGLNDGATASILASADAARSSGSPRRCAWSSFAFAGVEPEIMGIGPVPSTEKALRKAGLTIADIGLFELNEAFAVQVLSLLDHFGIDDDDPRVNQWGGAIAIGHPLASSGVRLMIQLAAQFAERPDVRYGLTAMCVGLGQGGSVIWENPHYNGKQEVSRHAESTSQNSQPSTPTRSSRTPSCATCRFSGGKMLALITLDNGRDHTRPNTLGPNTLLELGATARRAKGTRGRGEIARRRHHRQAVHPRRRRRPLEDRRHPGSRDRQADGAARPLGARQAHASSACRRSCSSTGSRSAAASRSR